MIIRKPYAFLIKNFKKIHVILLLLSLFVAYKLVNVSSFVQEFMKLGTYDLNADPITNHITFLLQLSVFILIIGSGSLILLLKHKEKPWKTYLVPFIEYLILFFVLSMIKSFFMNFTDDVATTDLRMSRDLLLIFIVAQVPAIFIFIMRTFGLDLKKFNFNMDEEFLELSESDREEIEIRLDVDKNTFKRTYKKLIRNISYVYKEHKTICNIIIAIICIFFIYKSYQFIFVTNRSYMQGDVYNANGYTIKVNNAYYTDKDGAGNVISKISDFVIVDVSITNNSSRRKLNLNYFHLKSASHDYTTTNMVYQDEFSDLGKCVDSTKEISMGETVDTIIIYKVDKKKWLTNFVLYYQESGGNNTLRKIKLDVTDLSEIKKATKLSMGDAMKIKYYKTKEEIIFDSYEVGTSFPYYMKSCTTASCSRKEYTVTASRGYNILKLTFASINYEEKNTINFLEKYGKIIYKSSEGSSEEVEVKDAVDKSYYGKTLYIKVPDDLTEDSSISLKITIRNKQYIYKLN